MTQTNQSELALSLDSVGSYYWRRQSYSRREKYWALKNITFDVRHGESLGVIGRNGAGKSTLLALLAGITRPDRGVLINHGVTATLLSLQVGFIPSLTARDNAILSGLMLGLRKKEVEQRMNEIAEFAELGEFFDQPVETYSAGMKARLGFAAAFQLDPDVLLVDEVLGVGDQDFKQKSAKLMREKIRSDKTVVMVSNSLATITKLCDRAVWINEGVTQATGDPQDVVDEYTDFLKHRS